MLFSPAGQIAFAHYPKTAGCSLTRWFRGEFPDAAYVEPGNSHLPVRPALERLGLVPAPLRRPRLARECLRLVRQVAPGLVAHTRPCDLPIIGVVREPFEMLISLYEYWGRCRFREEPRADLIRTARAGTFRDFLSLAVGERHVAPYHTFFDVGGPAWHATRLIDFHSLGAGLAAVCEELGIEPPAELGKFNAAPAAGRDLGRYRAEAGGLLFDVRRHFRWYYEEATRVIVRGRPSSSRRAA